MPRDGMWLRAELLHLGLWSADTGRPLALGGVYAGGDPIGLADRDGYWVDLAWDLTNVALGLARFKANMSDGNYGGAALDAAGVAVDSLGAALPFVPAGAGTAIRAKRIADKAGEVAKGAGGFLVHKNRTAVHRSQADMEDSITGAGAIKIGDATRTAEGGAIYRMDTSNGPIDVRVMDGQPGGGVNQGPRTVTTRAGTGQGVHPDGSQVKAAGRQGPTKDEVQGAMHTHEQVNDR